MQYYGYEVKPEFVDESRDEIMWGLSCSAEYILATKEGKTYFIVRSFHIRYPSKDLPSSAYDLYLKDVLKIQNKQKKLKSLMSSLSTDRDRIIPVHEYFWDNNSMFVTVTESISDCLPYDYDFSQITKERFIQLSLDFAERLRRLHSTTVIHGDLKEKNILVKEMDGVYYTYLRDFDCAYSNDDIPEWDSMSGTEGYRSPESACYIAQEEEGDPSTITSAIDIFSAAVVMHRWWTGGSFPGYDFDEYGEIGQAVYCDSPIVIDKRFDVQIGSSCGATLMSLMNWMLTKEPSARPTAEQVVAVLKDELAVPEKYHTVVTPAHKRWKSDN